jgi:putative SOS response-associated peptidase YedK
MCDLYSETKGQDAIRRLARVMRDRIGHLPPHPAIFPDMMAPVLRNAPDGVRELIFLRWGMPAPPAFPSGTDRGVTNIRDLDTPHWRPWLGVANRCIVPATSFSEPSIKPDPLTGKKVWHWFALGEDQPLFAFAGIWCTWRGIRGSKAVSIETEHELFGFLTTEPNAEVRTVHEKAMPVILRTEDEIELWMTAPIKDALALQRPLPDGTLKIVRTGVQGDSFDV